MAVNTDAVGKQFPPVTYAVGREKVREFARAVGETEPLYLDVEAARAAGYRDVVAPPMFAVVYAMPALAPAMVDPEVGIDFSRLLHGGQEFVWRRLVVAGDEITTTAELVEVSERAGNGFYTFETRSVDQEGAEVCVGRWMNVVRAA
ncbi:MAG: MaoC family dehydratase N-terminal domain-containing protein [Solirubrobacteraceae bacterium]|nr:MaoC family dehydratase N-terminal domain-containing protein [Solirubrobacteraceae bacterium]